MNLSSRSPFSLLLSGLGGVVATLIFVHPSIAQDKVSRPRIQGGVVASPDRSRPEALKLLEYTRKRMHVLVRDFSPNDAALDRKTADRTLRGAGSALIVLSPDDLDHFDNLAYPEFHIYDSLNGVTYKRIVFPPPTPNHGAIDRANDPFSRYCYWYESSDKGNRVMLAFHPPSRTVKAMLTRVIRDGSEGIPVNTGTGTGIFSMRIEVLYHGKKERYFGDAVFRLYSGGNGVRDGENLDQMTRHMFYNASY